MGLRSESGRLGWTRGQIHAFGGKVWACGPDLCMSPNNGGARIFPGKLTPDDDSPSLRRQVRLVATIDPPIPGVWVYFKVFDVDDPFDQDNPNMADVELIDGDEVGGDNRGSGEALGNCQEMTNALGRAVVPLVVSMQPGDNYRAAASVLDDALDQVSQADADALNVSSYWRSWSGYKLPVVWSPMLTVWRKLHVETDSMVRPTFAQNTFTMDWNEPEEGGVPTQIRFDVDDPWNNPFQTDDEQFTNGYVEIQNNGGTAILAARVTAYGNYQGGDDWVLINVPDCGGGQSGLACLGGVTSGKAVFSDDDLSDQATFTAKIWGCDDLYAGGAGALLPPDVSALETRYEPAYIKPVHETSVSGTGGMTTFIRNQAFGVTGNYGKAFWDQVLPIRALPVPTADYWTVMIVAAWQAEENTDADPDAETAVSGSCLGVNTHSEGETTATWWLGSGYTGIGAIFKALSLGPAESERMERFSVAHEVGHMLGLPHNDVDPGDPPMGLMDPRGPGQDLPFVAENLNRLRDYDGP